MANQALTDLISEVNRTTTLDDSILAFLQGVPGLIQTAVDAAMANGASAAELQPLTQLKTDLSSKNDLIVAAMSTNTPAAALRKK
jgi:hypothetical protein